jgi:mono/diheme cytochrome c family protein
LGQQLFADNCADCHGDFGEGGENPTRPNDIIAPISSAEYLKTRDDPTLRAIIAQGQPNFGMSPFSSAFGGPLEDADIDAIVSFMRGWESNPPVELPPDIPAETLALDSSEIFLDVCSQCHGLAGEGGTGPSLRAPDFRATNTLQDIYDSINLGHPATQMIAWGSILSAGQIEELATYILSLPILEPTPTPEAQPTAAPGQATPTPAAPTGISYEVNVRPIFEARCLDCHGTDGGWDAATYDAVMTSGDHAPVITPGDPEASLLAQKLLGTHAEGDIMPPPPLRPLPEAQIAVILEWILAGAPE